MSELAASDGRCQDQGDSKQLIQQLKVSIGVSTTVHFLSILMKLRRSNVHSPLDWNWFKLPRYYYTSASADGVEGGKNQVASVQIRIANTSFAYKFDLLPVEVAQSQVLVTDHNISTVADQSAKLPNGQHISVKRLIATETSERCFLVASQSVAALKLGASPFGPAGSGKTETIKALGQLVGCQVIVHNCDETNESDALERLVWGLAHTGLWGCFDEFNRLSSNTLSRVSEVLELVQSNLRLNRTNVELADGQIKSIDPDSAFFITLNPGDSLKYRGRRRLPANLRALFLPIAMVRVQIDSIVSGILLVFSASSQMNRQARVGAKDACSSIDAALTFEIGRKLANWIDWTRDSFGDSLASRCEWDLRLVMVILKRFKILVLNWVDSEGAEGTASDGARCHIDSIIVKSIRCEVEPRLGQNEIRLLDESIKRFFGDKSSGLQSGADQEARCNKLIQFSEQLKLRAGVILLGKTKSGKSACWRNRLKEINANNSNCSQVVQSFTLNPKSYDKNRLYGYFDETTHKWIDGIFTKLVRGSLSLLQTDQGTQQVWIVLDGGVDPDWIECLNSVLDDNQVLTLSSGERLNFVTFQNKHIKLIIETDDISYASPATISRLGLVYFETNSATNARDSFVIDKSSTSNLILIHGGSEYQQRRSIGKQYCQKVARTCEFVEYNCSEFSTSEHLVEILMQNQETCKCYLINNLDLIQASDKWGTRSFVELLRYAISYKCYYATQMNCIDMGDDFKFIVTLKDGLEGIKDKRLISLASVVEVGSNDNPKSDETISTKQILHEALEDFLEANLFEDASRTASILLLKTENIMEFTRQTCELIQGKFGKKIELFTFNNSIAQVSSMHKLSRLTGEATTTTTSTTAANASDNPAVTQSDDKLVAFLINSFELKFLAPSVKRKLYHSANKLRAMHAPRYHRVVFLIYYMNPGGNESDLEVDTDLDYIYWLSMSEVVHEINQASQLSEAKLQNSLTSKFKEDRRATGLDQMDWLAGQVGNMFKDKHYQTNAHNTASSRQAFMNMLVDIILKANESIDSQRRLLSNGLDKLNEFEASVARLEAQREAENELLASKKLELESLMSQIEVKMRASEQKRKESQELERLQQIKSREIAEQKRKIKEELSEVLPLIEQSKQEVGKSLRPEALNEIKTLRSPPKTIKDILDVLFIFLDVTDTTWAAVKAYLNKYSLRDELTNYDFERRLTKPLLAKIKQEIKLRHDSFQMQQAKRASSAIVPIVKWIEAAIQYGQVLIVLGPLRENLQGLERESKRVSDSVAALENERVHLEDTIERNRKKLGELDRNYLEAKRTSEQINCDLDKARDVIRDSKRQTQMWHSKLESLEQLSTDKKQLYRLSLVCSLVAIFGDKLDRLVELIKVFDTTSIGPGMGEKEALEFYLRNYYNVLMDSCDGEPVDLTRFKQHEWHQVLQLVNLKLCAHFGHYPLVPYLMFDKTRETNTDELANLMCSNNIVCSRDDLVVLQPFGENATNWRQLAELARQMNKLTLIKIYTASDSSIAATVLDIFDLAKSNSRLVLFGNIGPMQTTIKQIEMMSRPVHVLASVGVENSALEGVAFETVITETLMQYYDPKLSEIVGELELELQTKQKEAKQLELSLVKRLMSWSASSTSDSKKRPGGDLAAPLSNDLVQMLSNLHQARESLANNIADIKVKLKEYHSKQERFLQVSRRAAIFYELFIANLQDVNQFYSLPLSSYVKILTETRRKNLATANQPAATTVNSIEFGEAEFVQVLTHVMSSMRPNYRSKFQAKLLAADSRQSSSSLQFNSKHKSVDLSAGSIGKAATLAANFQQAIIEQLVDLSNKARGQPDKKDSTDSHWFKLIVVLHDAKRPSPQVIVDELFRHNNSKTSAASNIGECQYYKLYASGDLVQNATSQLKSTDCKTNPLELQLSRIIDCMELQANQTNAAGNADHFTSKSQSGSGRQVGAPIRCVCVANAHLASSWINSRLLELIKERTRNKKRTVTSAKLMIILIAESESSDSKQLSSTGVVDEASTNATGDSGQFVQNLLDSSELKFWYDELALNLSDRYNLYYKLICDNYIYQDLNRVIRLSDNSKARFNEDKSELFDLDTLVKDLVLLHVVCQELVKLTSCREALGGGDFDLLWHKDYYNFDYEQLCLALKMLKQIVQDNASRQKGATSSISTRQSVRYLFGHLLETIVYGSRMETLHDEQLLERLLRQLIHSTGSHSVREQLMNFIRKLETSRGEQIGLTSGTPGSESLSAQIELKNAKELSRIIAIVRQE